jgi:sodium-dependent phosphate cotransporter
VLECTDFGVFFTPLETGVQGERRVRSQQDRRRGWKRVGLGLSGLLFFVLALELMKEGAGGLAPLLRGHLDITNTADSMGFGWLMAYLVLSGSPVAVAAVALLSADALSSLQAFTMVAGSRLGAGLIVLLVGFIYILRGHEQWTALTAGVLSLLLTGSIQLGALPMGLLTLGRGWLDDLSIPALAGLAAGVNRGLGPLIDPLVAFLPSWALFVAGVGLATLCFRFFDRALPQVRLERTNFDQIPWLIYRPGVMFLMGLAITLFTMSVSISIGILVPLSARGYMRRENIIPYILGANISTLVDTLVAAALLGDPRAVTVVVTHMICASVVSLLIIVFAYRPYERAISRVLAWTTRRRENFALFMGIIFVIPVALVLM